MPGRFENFNLGLSSWFERIGVYGLLIMMAVTCIDVVGAKIFHWRLFGAIDMVMLSQILAISFGAAMALILGRHIQVEFFVNKLPWPLQAIVESFIHLLGIFLFGLIIWQLSSLGYNFWKTGEYSATASIPYYFFAFGIAIASLPVLLILLQRLLKSLGRIF